MLQIQLFALALAAIALAATGCGGSSKSATGNAAATTPSTARTAPTPTRPAHTIALATGTPLTRARWIAKGDAICARVNREVAGTPANSVSDYARLLPQIAAYYSKEATDLSKLVPPTSMAHDGEQIVNGLQLLSEYLSKSGQAFQAGNVSAGSQLFRTALTIQEQPIAVAERDGFKKCTDTN
jgi:hypothetical protein